MKSIEIEKSLLGACMLDSKTCIRLVTTIQEYWFSNTYHKIIFRAICQIVKEDKSVDTLSVITFLDINNSLDRVGGQAYIANLLSQCSSLAYVDTHLELLQEVWQKRHIKEVCQKYSNFSILGKKSLDVACDIANELKFNLDAKTGLVGVSDFIHDVIKKFGQEDEGIKCGYDIDDLMRLANNRLTVLAARPSMGKTTLMFNIALNIAKQGKKVAIYSLEQTKEDLLEKAMCNMSGLSKYKIRHIKHNKQFIKACEELSNLDIIINDTAGLTVMDIKSELKLQDKKPDLVCIDHIGKLRSTNSRRSLYEQTSEISNDLRELSNHLDISVLAVAQLGRAVEQRTNKKPQISDLRDSGKIEEDANHVMLMYRESYYNYDCDNDICDIYIAKNRHGRTGNVKLMFDMELSKFSNISYKNKEENINGI